jgi:hypothetical protein
MRVSKTATDKLPYPRPAAEPATEQADSPPRTTVDTLKRLDVNRDGKLDQAEFTTSGRYQSADERQREVMDRAYAAAAGQSGVIETEENFEALVRLLDDSEPVTTTEEPSAASPSLLDGVAAAYEAVTGFFGDLFGKMKRAASEFVTWAGDQLNRLTRGFFEPFQTEVERQPETPDLATAQSRLRESAEDEEEALAALPPQDREAYQAVASVLASDQASRLALRELLLGGGLPGGKDLADGKSLLSNLAALSKQPLADGIDRQELLADVLSQLKDPLMISQEQQNTCGPTTAQLLLAMQEPAEYVRLAAGLASPAGRVRLQNGDAIAREPDWDDKEGDRRTVANRLFQSALMECANGRFDYRNAQDGRKVMLGPIELNVPGLLPHEMGKLVENLTGREHDVTLSIMSDRVTPALQSAIERASPGNEVPILVNYNVSGGGVQNLSPHYLLITGQDPETGLVCVTNPWGREERIAPKELQRHLIALMPGR